MISKDVNNERLDDVIVALCTTNTSRAKKENTQYLIEGEELKRSGLRYPTAIKCETLITIHKDMIIGKFGSLTKKAIEEIDICLKDALQLP